MIVPCFFSSSCLEELFSGSEHENRTNEITAYNSEIKWFKILLLKFIGIKVLIETRSQLVISFTFTKSTSINLSSANMCSLKGSRFFPRFVGRGSPVTPSNLLPVG